MNENNYKKKLDFQQNMIARQSNQIKELTSQVELLKQKLIEKDDVINSVSSLREEYKQCIDEIKKRKKEYTELINEIRKMKDIINQEVYKGRWKIIKYLIK